MVADKYEKETVASVLKPGKIRLLPIILT